MSKRDEEVQLNLDQEGIERAIAALQKMKTLPQGTRVCDLGAHGINSSLYQAIAKIEDAEILMNYYLYGGE